MPKIDQLDKLQFLQHLVRARKQVRHSKIKEQL